MQYIRGIEGYQNTNPSAITLGKFDGLHQGHELLIERVERHQNEDGVDGIVFAFDMAPLFQKLNKPANFILSNEEKASRLEHRVRYFIDCPFDETIAKVEAEDFIKDILVGKFHAKYIVVGTDFRFGYQKRGDAQLLESFAAQYGYQVEVVEKKVYQGREISSTYIKEELKKGNAELVNTLLGYEYSKK